MPTKTANHSETEQHAKTNESSRSGGYYINSEPCTVVLFGASGDLAKRKVIPAMYDLANHQALGSSYAIVGFARTPMNDDSSARAVWRGTSIRNNRSAAAA